MDRFFDRYERFYVTSSTSPHPIRLNARHSAIISHHSARLSGRRVLDIASHDGRWAFAALHAGAAHVTGVEPREALVRNANKTFSNYGIEGSRYRFVIGDVFDHLYGAPQYDVVLCLGFFYHTSRHVELMDRIERTKAEFVVVDTEVTNDENAGPVDLDADSRLVRRNPFSVHLLSEPVDLPDMAVADSTTRNGKAIVGRPTRAAMTFLAAHFGFACERYPWPRHFDEHPHDIESMADYVQGWRDTYYLTRVGPSG